MTRARTIALIGIVAIAVLGSLLWLRFALIGSAHADLRTRGFFTFEILGTRIPCAKVFDLGVMVIYQNTPTGIHYESGRLCRSIASEWTWHPS